MTGKRSTCFSRQTGGLLLRLFCASVSSEEFYISPSHEHKFPLAEVELARKLSIFIFVTVILASVLFVQAQQPKKVSQIGYLSSYRSS